MARSAALFFLRGPAATVGTLIGAVFTIVGLVQIARQGPFWQWIAIGALALVAVSFFSYHHERLARDRSLERQLDDLIREGMELVDVLCVSLHEAYPDYKYPLVPEGERVDQAADFFARARELLVNARPSLLPCFSGEFNAVRRKEREAFEQQNGSTEGFEGLQRFVEYQHARPRVVVEGALAGLAEAREQL